MWPLFTPGLSGKKLWEVIYQLAPISSNKLCNFPTKLPWKPIGPPHPFYPCSFLWLLLNFTVHTPQYGYGGLLLSRSLVPNFFPYRVNYRIHELWITQILLLHTKFLGHRISTLFSDWKIKWKLWFDIVWRSESFIFVLNFSEKDVLVRNYISGN